jgi:hypothetical protein
MILIANSLSLRLNWIVDVPATVDLASRKLSWFQRRLDVLAAGSR